MESILNKLRAYMLVPVIQIEDADKAEKLAGALCRAGLPLAEVTFRTEAAAEAIERMKKAYPDMLIGAGTVLTVEQADRAMQAGATFLVSPGLNPEVVQYAQKKGYPMVPGVCTPSEIEKGLSLGLTTLKFFPAEASGGLGMIKAISAPYPMVSFMPTGGIHAKNIASYLQNEKVLCCGGSWIVPGDALKAGDFETIEALSREAVKNMLGLSVKCVSGLSQKEAEKALAEFPFELADNSLPVADEGNAEIVLQSEILFRVAAHVEELGWIAEEKLDNEKNKICRFEFSARFGGVKISIEQK